MQQIRRPGRVCRGGQDASPDVVVRTCPGSGRINPVIPGIPRWSPGAFDQVAARTSSNRAGRSRPAARVLSGYGIRRADHDIRIERRCSGPSRQAQKSRVRQSTLAQRCPRDHGGEYRSRRLRPRIQCPAGAITRAAGRQLQTPGSCVRRNRRRCGQSSARPASALWPRGSPPPAPGPSGR